MKNANFRACVECNRIQPIEHFQRQNTGTFQRRPRCKMCRSRKQAPGNPDLHYATLYYFKGQPSARQLKAHAATDAARIAYVQCLIEEAQAMGYLSTTDQTPLPEAGQSIQEFLRSLATQLVNS